MVSQILKTKGMKTVFNSSQIPGEILDLAGGPHRRAESSRWLRPEVRQSHRGRLVRSDGQMSAAGPAGDKVLTGIAEASQDTLASYKEQLAPRTCFTRRLRPFKWRRSPDLKKTMDLVRQFCFTHGLLGDNTNSLDDVAIRFPDEPSG